MEELTTLAVQKLLALQGRISQLRLLRFPSDNPTFLIDLFSRITETLIEKVKSRYDESQLYGKADSAERHSLEREIKFSIILAQQIAANLRYIESASVERTPWSCITPLEKLARDLLPDTSIVVRPQWHYNYGVLELVGQYRKKTENFFTREEQDRTYSGLPSYVYVLSFPSIERKNVLLHVNFGHEVGHPFADKYLAGENGVYLLEIKAKVIDSDYYKQTEDQQLSLFSAKQAESVRSIVNGVADVRRRALQEIICDLVSVELFGVAAVFALHEVATFSENFDSIDERGLYPPWRTRLRLALEAVNWSEWDACLSKVSGAFGWATTVMVAIRNKMTKLQKLVEDDVDQRKIRAEELDKIAYDSVYQALPEVKRFLADELRAYRMNPTESECKNIFRLVERLQNNIPPNEVVDDANNVVPMEMRTIFNAGWYFKHTYRTSMYDKTYTDDYFSALDVMNRLLLRAAEMSDLQREYATFKKA